ncbi:ArsB/NhaD family transporter [Eggerthella lenta]|uniref:ArsB/NhaD family transporter n=1 Tax=Eggerthella lenta TaxID=84112 RepID=UPI00232BAC23|nr:ArsB/NhaD family transporter [Eggerthella lenta]MDB1768011.1 ArsB/NhaD family transporter [Eggerthella lenta]MDB1773763.1 ArsB/NhaD family transporter [Eggerthella lenta]MDB1779208.1 ArsB/NhaD family transporter [Eggerthella lenta]MDB1781599.1 ArsB/NhaD family transporter [Eggerthella lenta]
MDVSQIVAVAVFVVVMITIMTEKLHRSLAAITGAMIVLALHVMPFDAAMEHIDFNTLGVLLGMMLFVSVVKLSGVFEFLAIKCARLAKGDPWKIMLLFVLLTAVLSAFLDNVTTVLLIGPMTLTVCKLLDVNPIPFFMTEILASNIGGTATLIGDPPNIMIGSAAGYSFFDFILYDAPAVAIILVAILGVFYALYGRKMNVDDEHKTRIMELDEHAQIKNRRLLKQSVVMTALVVVGFMAHGALGLESCIIALGAAGIIMLISGESIEEALSNVEWTTLSFFAGLFVIVGALAETGVIGMLANGLIDATGGNVFITMLVLLIGSAVISSFLDNIPFVATMIPILLAMESTGMDVTPLWWAVSLGACLGGNGTLIGASANVVLSDISKKHGYEITFAKFFKTGFPIMLLTILIAGVYLVVRFPPA